MTERWGGRPVVRRLADARPRDRVAVTGVVTAVNTERWRGARTCIAELHDGTASLYLHFMGRPRVAGLAPGTVCRVEGTVLAEGARLLLWDPLLTLLPPGAGQNGAP